MRKSDDTKLRILNALINQTRAKGDSNVSITEICQESGVSRRSFYYHFDSIADAISWKFAHDLGQALVTTYENDPETSLVYPKDSPNAKYTDLPYYARKVPGVRTIDASAFFRCLHESIRKHQEFYSIIAHTEDGRQFLDRLTSQYIPQIRSDIKFIAGGRTMKASIVEMLAADFVLTRIVSCFHVNGKHGLSYPSDEKGLENIAHDALKLEVNAYLKANKPQYIIKDLRRND